MTDVSTPSDLYHEMEDDRALCRCLMGGTAAMREARAEYLPQEDGESDEAYDARLNRTTLYNGFKRTVESHAGKVFDRPAQVKGSGAVIEWSENITNDGRNVSVFGRELLERVLSEGVAFIQVEYPKAAPDLKIGQVRAMKLRPYMIEVPPNDLIYWRWNIAQGVPVVMEVRIKETDFDEEGEEIDQVRVLTPGAWEVHRKTDSGDWFVFDQGATSPIDRVPIIPVYAERKGVYQSPPPMRDLADLNEAHWQSSSDQRHILHTARVPILFGAGLEDDFTRITVGPNRLIKTSNANASLQYVEHTGAAIDAGRQDLLDLERRMGAMGLELLVPDRPGDMTATEKAIEKAENESALQTIAKNLQNSLQQALEMMQEWVGQSGEIEVDINSSFEIKITDQTEIQALMDMRSSGDLSQESFWREMKRRGVLRDDFDPEEESTALEAEGPRTPMQFTMGVPAGDEGAA